MQMLQSDCLSCRTLSAISVQLLEVVRIMATFSRFSDVSEENLEIFLDNNLILWNTKKKKLTVVRL